MSVYLQSTDQNSNVDVEDQGFHNTEGKAVNLDHDISRNVSNVSVNVSKDLVAAAGFNVETPIVNAIIGNITGVLPTKKNEINETVKCEVCDCEITSNAILAHHINGSRHRKRLKALDIIAQLKEEKGVHLNKCETPNGFRCDICSLTVNSAQQLEFHLSGAKHKKNIAKTNSTVSNTKNAQELSVPDETVNKPSPKKPKKQETKPQICTTCNIVMNSQNQYEQHLASKKHKQKGTKPSVPRQHWSAIDRPQPYSKFKMTNKKLNVNPNLDRNNCLITFYCNSNQYNSPVPEHKNFSYCETSSNHSVLVKPNSSNCKYSDGQSQFSHYPSQNTPRNYHSRNNFERSQIY